MKLQQCMATLGNDLAKTATHGKKMQRMATLSNNFFHGKILTNLNLTESFS
jgi:hypothetical protein